MIKLLSPGSGSVREDFSTIIPAFHAAPDDDAIRLFAYHLYLESHCAPGHDLDNWFEAKACLQANIPEHCTRSRLHHHVHVPTDDFGRALFSTPV